MKGKVKTLKINNPIKIIFGLLLSLIIVDIVVIVFGKFNRLIEIMLLFLIVLSFSLPMTSLQYLSKATENYPKDSEKLKYLEFLKLLCFFNFSLGILLFILLFINLLL